MTSLSLVGHGCYLGRKQETKWGERRGLAKEYKEEGRVEGQLREHYGPLRHRYFIIGGGGADLISFTFFEVMKSEGPRLMRMDLITLSH